MRDFPYISLAGNSSGWTCARGAHGQADCRNPIRLPGKNLAPDKLLMLQLVMNWC
jgi:hypothetical protein